MPRATVAGSPDEMLGDHTLFRRSMTSVTASRSWPLAEMRVGTRSSGSTALIPGVVVMARARAESLGRNVLNVTVNRLAFMRSSSTVLRSPVAAKLSSMPSTATSEVTAAATPRAVSRVRRGARKTFRSGIVR